MIETRRAADSVRSASPEETRERILAAGREVIARKGKRGATTREIADVAGVNEATLFRHFGTKEALIVAVAQHFCGFVALRGVASQLNGEVTEDLLVLGRAMLERMESQIDMIRWSLVEQEYEADIFAATAWRPQLAIMEVVAEFMQRRITAGELHGDPMKLALTYMGFIFMHVLARKKFPNSELHQGGADAALRFYIDVFLNGVRNR
ncbi:MAG: TetR/AcrR family transcriptional regulator [Candidatus Eremiobacteraeota bacterium]|nr:TetR/AcrR family transcriptional regulator [Candidatus Eremiobacteraeota bacterium]